MTTGRSLLITGAGGFIGSHLAEAALNAGWNTTLLLRYSSHGGIGNLSDLSPSLLARARIVHGDITDSRQIERLCVGMDSVIHLAALIGIPYSYDAPESYVATNVSGTLNLLEAARKAAVGRTVVVSTSEVYGNAQAERIDETHPVNAQSPYAATKIAAEALARAWSASFGLHVSVVRPFNTYGPRQSQRAVIPTIIAQALLGGTIRLGSVWPIRDFTYVTDTAQALLVAAGDETMTVGPYNLGTGHSVSVGTLVEEVGRLLGKTLSVTTDDARIRPAASEVDRLTADNRLFCRSTGWTPVVGLTEGLARTLAHIRQTGLPGPPAYRV